MRYCTLQDMIDTYGEARLAELSDRVNMPATTIDASIVDRAIADAEAEINMYLAGRHNLPLASVPVMLTRIACDLAWTTCIRRSMTIIPRRSRTSAASSSSTAFPTAS